jgi:hypothetical protein
MDANKYSKIHPHYFRYGKRGSGHLSETLSIHSPGHLIKPKIYGVSAEVEQLPKIRLEMIANKIGEKVKWLELHVVV